MHLISVQRSDGVFLSIGIQIVCSEVKACQYVNIALNR